VRTGKQERTLVATGLVALLLLAACAPRTQGEAPASAQRPANARPATGASPAAQPAGEAPSAAEAGELSEAERREVENFYRGKSVRVLVGFAPGAGYDLFARLTAKYLPKYLPGSPNVVVENMPGAGSALVANNIYNLAAKDGTVIGTFDPALALAQAVGASGGALQFDPAQYPWLGSPNSSTNICAVRADTGADSMEKLLASSRDVVFGATSLGNSTSAQPAVMQHYLGAKVRIVTGYDGTAKVKLAVEGGEADGSCGTWETIKASNSDWFTGSTPFARVIVKAKDDTQGDLKDVPLMTQYLRTDEARQVQAMAMAPQAIGFNYAAPPGTPPARLKALRNGLMQAWNDSEYQAEATKAQLVPYPQDYQTVQRLVAEILSASPETLQKAKDVLGIQ
jgi:tripartite-type tricarboxylate transporter receptor subunit TctC